MRFEISEILTQDQVMDLVYGNNSTPKRILGRHYVKDGQVIAAYHPDAVRIELIRDNGRAYPMDQIERQPVYAIYLPGKEPFHYCFRMYFQDGNTFVTDDPYCVPCQITGQEVESFLKGTWIDAYEKMGCHQMTINGVDGVYFALWAPGARRVSVVGDFNFWNGMIYPMNRLEESGIFELFLPGLTAGHLYKYEVKTMQGNVYQRRDPCGLMFEGGSGDVSKIIDMNNFPWKDEVWMKNRKYRLRRNPVTTVCDVFDGSQLDRAELFDGSFTHLLFSRFIIQDESRQPDRSETGVCQVPYCNGSADKFRTVIDDAHRHNVSVLMELSPGYFIVGERGTLEGSALYGYPDSRIGYDPGHNMWRFCFEKPEVRSMVLSSFVFWIRQYHIDGFILEGVRDMLMPEIDTSNMLDIRLSEEISRIPEVNSDFLHHLIQVIHQEDISVMLIADGKPNSISGRHRFKELYQEFDYLWDSSIRHNLRIYLASDAGERHKEHYRLTLPLQNQDLESSLVLINSAGKREDPDPDIDNPADGLYDKLSAEMRMTEAFLMGVPGKKVWTWIRTGRHEKGYIRNLLAIYGTYPALHEQNLADTSFEWLNCVDALSSVVSFIRRSFRKKEILLFVSNFGDQAYEQWRIGVPAYGRYRMILNSEAAVWGGRGLYEGQDAVSIRQRWDFRPFSIEISLPPRATLIFEYISL